MIHSSPVDADNLHSQMMQREKQELRLVPCVKSPLETSLRLFVCQRLSISFLFSIYPINNATISDSSVQIDVFQKSSRIKTPNPGPFLVSYIYNVYTYHTRLSNIN